MKKIWLIILILILIVTIILLPNVDAAGVNLGVSSSKGTINPGDTVTININLGGSMGSATVNLSFNNSLFDYVSASGGAINNLGNEIRIVYFDSTGGTSPRSSMSVTFKAKSTGTGTGTFTATGTGFANPDASTVYSPVNSGSTTVKVEEKVTLPSNNNPTTPQTSTNNPSGNSAGSNVSQNNASSNAYLKTLRLNREGMTPVFNKNTLNYSITVDTSVNSIDVTVTPEDSNAKVNINGNTGLKSGNNKITIVVTAADNKTKKTYTINVSKTNNPELANANLENLAVENETLMPEFTPENTDYTLQIGSTVDKLNILAVPQKPEATAVISGNENLDFGENTITITVTAADKITIKDYIIAVHKMTAEEELALLNEITDEAIKLETEEIKEEIKKTNWIAITVGTITAVAAGAGGYIAYNKFGKKK